jgi:hypothetical protein
VQHWLDVRHRLAVECAEAAAVHEAVLRHDAALSERERGREHGRGLVAAAVDGWPDPRALVDERRDLRHDAVEHLALAERRQLGVLRLLVDGVAVADARRVGVALARAQEDVGVVELGCREPDQRGAGTLNEGEHTRRTSSRQQHVPSVRIRARCLGVCAYAERSRALPTSMLAALTPSWRSRDAALHGATINEKGSYECPGNRDACSRREDHLRRATVHDYAQSSTTFCQIHIRSFATAASFPDCKLAAHLSMWISSHCDHVVYRSGYRGAGLQALLPCTVQRALSVMFSDEFYRVVPVWSHSHGRCWLDRSQYDPQGYRSLCRCSVLEMLCLDDGS